MVEESAPPLPPPEESIEAESEATLEPEPESGPSAHQRNSETRFICEYSDEDRGGDSGIVRLSLTDEPACRGEAFYNVHGNKRYCVLHYPGKQKTEAFENALKRKRKKKNSNFHGVWFPDSISFDHYRFAKNADFGFAIFNDAVTFSSAKFMGDADFRASTFCADSDFYSAEFRAHASFYKSVFASVAYFSEATFSADADFNGAAFSAGADFSDATIENFGYFWGATFSGDADFRSTRFGAGANFIDSRFETDADFSLARVDGDAKFSSTTFGAAVSFDGAIFNADAKFDSAEFGGPASFSEGTFNAKADFMLARFLASVNFLGLILNKNGDFRSAVFNDAVNFSASLSERCLEDGTPIKPLHLGKQPSLDLQYARMEQPTRVSFQHVTLSPNWFINVDCREFDFVHVTWNWNVTRMRNELETLNKDVDVVSTLLSTTFRRLAENVEANNRYEEASRFRYWAMDLARRTKWKGLSFWKTDWLHMLYWAVSGYGERIRNALGVLAAVWVVFALLYTEVGFEQKPPKASNDPSSATAASITVEDRIGHPLTLKRALTYSLAVMSLQKPEPKPLTGTAQTLVLVETILGPVQAALLALAIRRKFMR